MSAYGIIRSPTGNIAIHADGAAVTKVFWTNEPEHAPSGDQDDRSVVHVATGQINAYFEDPKTVFDLPLHATGNDFEHAVWRAMQAIPSGHTASYGDLAGIVGRPARAVGGACGRNPIPIVVPCHRVIAADGRLTGFSGGDGIETKRWLLRHEGALLI